MTAEIAPSSGAEPVPVSDNVGGGTAPREAGGASITVDDEPVVVNAHKSLGSRFWRLWWATAISSSGDGLLRAGLPLLAFTLTHGPVAIAGVTATQKAAAAVASLPAGMATDRFERRSVMLACNIVSGLALFGLVAVMTAGRAGLVLIYVVAAVLAACDVTYTLAMQASVPDVVASSDLLPTANGRIIGVDTAGDNMVGPGCGGLLFAAAQRLPFFGDSLSFFVSAFLVRASVPRSRALPRHARNEKVAARPPSSEPVVVDGQNRHGSGWMADLSTGFRVFRRQRPLKLLSVTVASVTFSQSAVVALLVVYGERTLHLSATGYGVFLAAASVLGIVGSFSGGQVQRRLGPAGTIVAGTALATASYIALSFTHLPVVAVFVFGLQEVGAAVANVASVTTRQNLIPRALFGRVGSVHRLLVTGAAPLGALFGGLVASVSNVTDAFLAAGLLQLVMLAYLLPQLARAIRGTPKA